MRSRGRGLAFDPELGVTLETFGDLACNDLHRVLIKGRGEYEARRSRRRTKHHNNKPGRFGCDIPHPAWIDDTVGLRQPNTREVIFNVQEHRGQAFW